jgi:hypothetical protein
MTTIVGLTAAKPAPGSPDPCHSAESLLLSASVMMIALVWYRAVATPARHGRDHCYALTIKPRRLVGSITFRRS